MVKRDKDEWLEKRLDELCDGFEKWVTIGTKEGRQDSPARHFHIKTIGRLRDKGLNNVFVDALFFDYLYATLATWGMDSRGAKLTGYNNFVRRIRESRGEILKLKRTGLNILAKSDNASNFVIIVNSAWEIVANLHMSESEIQLVAGTKALHHILPALVPPIDRNYTLKFFFGNKSISHDSIKQGEQFFKVLVGYSEIYERAEECIEELMSTNPLNSSITKTIDNAIIGYQKNKGSVTSSELNSEE